MPIYRCECYHEIVYVLHLKQILFYLIKLYCTLPDETILTSKMLDIHVMQTPSSEKQKAKVQTNRKKEQEM